MRGDGRSRFRPVAVPHVHPALVLLLAGLLGCGGSDGGAGGGSAAETSDGPGAVQVGAALFQALRCATCHNPNMPTTEMGAPLEGIFGKEVRLADGRTVVRDEAYLERAIRSPRAELVQGFGPAMPEFPQLSDADVRALIAYLKSR